MKYKSILLFLTISISIYAQDIANFSHYVFPDFQQGVVLLKNGVKNNAKLNYNAASEQMVFEDNGKILAIADALLPQIDTVFISDEKFVRVNNKFVKIIIDEPEVKLFVEYKCQIIPPGRPSAYGGTSQTSSTKSFSSIMSEGSVYSLKLPDEYKILPDNIYWINRSGRSKSFSSLKQLRKIYRDKKKVIDNYLKSNDVKLENEKSLKETIIYMEKESR